MTDCLDQSDYLLLIPADFRIIQSFYSWIVAKRLQGQLFLASFIDRTSFSA
jgi:hypothetical protein